MPLFLRHRLGGWRAALAVLSIYALFIQAMLGGFASGFSTLVEKGGKRIICGADSGVIGGAERVPGDRHGKDCSCPGLCSGQAAATTVGDAVFDSARWPCPRGLVRIFVWLVDLRAHVLAGVGLARAPPLSSELDEA